MLVLWSSPKIRKPQILSIHYTFSKKEDGTKIAFYDSFFSLLEPQILSLPRHWGTSKKVKKGLKMSSLNAKKSKLMKKN